MEALWSGFRVDSQPSPSAFFLQGGQSQFAKLYSGRWHSHGLGRLGGSGSGWGKDENMRLRSVAPVPAWSGTCLGGAWGERAMRFHHVCKCVR